jgi:hypothetical protein
LTGLRIVRFEIFRVGGQGKGQPNFDVVVVSRELEIGLAYVFAIAYREIHQYHQWLRSREFVPVQLQGDRASANDGCS